VQDQHRAHSVFGASAADHPSTRACRDGVNAIDDGGRSPLSRVALTDESDGRRQLVEV